MKYGSKSVIEELKMNFRYGGITTKLIFINVILFLFGWLLELIEFFAALPDDTIFGPFKRWFWLSSDLSEFIIKPYTLFSYQFLHSGFWHILFNMLVLYWFGRILSDFISQKKILPLYLMGGLAGAFLYLLLYNTLPVFADANGLLVGASASIMAILAAAAALAPDMEIRLFFTFRVRLKFLAAFLILINVFTVENGNAGGNFAHLGGAAFGFLFIYLIRSRGIDLSDPWNRFFDYVVGLFNRSPKPKVTFRNKKTVAKSSGNSIDKQEQLDAILDKIAANGYDSLSKAEKEFLFKTSKE